jgi:ComF family protein
VIDFVYPPECANCGKPGTVFCQECLSEVKLLRLPVCTVCGKPQNKVGTCSDCKTDPPPYNALRSWGLYQGSLREALHSLKYRSNLGFCRFLASQLEGIVRNNQWDLDLIIPVPLCKTHNKERGYNQSEMLAYPLSLSLTLPLVTDAVFRVKETTSQVDLTRDERFRNLEDAFHGNSAKLKGKKVLLVDDIVTTGATLISCTQALLDSGCKSVFCITVAQTAKKHHQTL